MEYILAAATLDCVGQIWFVDPPGRHHDVLAEMRRQGCNRNWVNDAEQGFVTSEARFVDRTEAKVIAEAAGQILDNEAPILSELYSENLW